MVLLLLFVIAVQLAQILDRLSPPADRAAWKNGKWNGVKDI